MNKTIKGSLAGAAGVALLMGGFGSYAMWSDSEHSAPAACTSGSWTSTPSDRLFDDPDTTPRLEPRPT